MSSSSSSSLQWLSLVATIWLQTVNGPNSDFPIYSSQLKQILSISQVQLNNLAFASDAGKLFGWCSGVATAYLPLRLVLLIGAAFGLIGYGIQFLFLANKIAYLSYWQVFMLTALAGNGICWINTVCYLICTRNFCPDSRIAAGLSTSYVGLSARVYTALVDFIFNPEPGRKAKAYLLLNASAPIFISVMMMPLLKVIKVDEGSCSGGDVEFLVMFVITLATGVCAVFGSIGSGRVWSTAHIVSLGVLLLSPIALPMFLKVKERVEERLRSTKESKVHVLTIEEVEDGERVTESEEDSEKFNQKDVEEGEDKEEEVGFRTLVRKLDFWLYFFSYMFGATLGLVFLNNLGQIAESRGLVKTSSLVSLASSFGFFGRVMPPLLDYYFAKKGRTISRPAFMATMMAPIAGAFILLLNSTTLFLYIATAIIGACSGSITSIAVSATPELFGTKNFAVNHNIIVTNIPIGSLVFGYFAAVLYQRKGGSESCEGTKCYSQTFIIWGSVCSIGTVLCTILYIRTRRFCSS
ncbi:uncharacterized protein A4U43_C02F2950 [Asparagus officinalis]|uniref:Uncharacterized protein n=1 Tax=Asparagus officinalis TaxID=4686 RepID=A0A5P1FFD4_ASPOF|nr:protein NUCLEAR FUSION DEFECTIVE 4 isoform X2 [Asparagus officinalis]ONK77085.1 uncharacterized protein A4U43_C02F2950 [Asparagus officinalis]